MIDAERAAIAHAIDAGITAIFAPPSCLSTARLELLDAVIELIDLLEPQLASSAAAPRPLGHA